VSNMNFRLMMVAMMPLDEPIRAKRPKKRLMNDVYKRPAWKNKGRRLARTMKENNRAT